MANIRLYKSLLAKIANDVVHLWNSSLIQKESIIVHENLKGKTPYFSHIKILKCPVWVNIPGEKRKNLNEKFYRDIHFGYKDKNKYIEYKLWTSQISVTQDIHFDNIPFYGGRYL